MTRLRRENCEKYWLYRKFGLCHNVSSNGILESPMDGTYNFLINIDELVFSAL